MGSELPSDFAKKAYEPPRLKRYGDIYEITGAIGINGSVDNVTGITRTGLPLIPADKHKPSHSKH